MSFILVAILVIAAVALVGIIVAVAFTPSRLWVWAAGLTSTVQLFSLPIGGIFPSANLLSGLACFNSIFSARQLLRHKWFIAAVAMMGVQALSIAWAKDHMLGFRQIVYCAPFFFMSMGMYAYTNSNKPGAIKLLSAVFAVALLESLLVIIFRLSPSIEIAFLSSRIARVFISPNVLGALFGDQPNNVFDAGKAGGLFVNANVAATFIAVCAVGSWYVGSAFGIRFLKVIGILHWIAIFFCGSKAAIIAALGFPAVLIFASIATKRKVSGGWIIGACLIISSSIIALPSVIEFYTRSGFGEDSASTFETRTIIWDFAQRAFFSSPFLGLGFGGWAEQFPRYAAAIGINPNLPAHNAFLILWAESGLLGALAGVTFAICLIGWGAKVASQEDKTLKSLGSGVSVAFGWIVFQAQGENFGLIGEAHITPVLALLLGFVASLYDSNSRRGAGVVTRD